MAAEQPQTHLEPPPWLKTLPVAPEFRPTLAEFLDPIAFILKIEKEASQYGICKIIPPLPPPSKNSALTNLTRSFASLMGSSSSGPHPTFATRKQQVGLCPRRPRPVQRAVWQSGERYNLPQFEDKVRQFERAQLRRVSCTKKSFSPLEVETLYWRSCADKPFTIEYANDMPGSGFEKQSENYIEGDGEGDHNNVGETAWNMRGVSRARGSLLRFMKEEIPGVTSPMVYVAMMYSWFAWHVEDHDLHSMNYLHFGGGKTWYGVPRDARLAFEDAVRVHGYGEEVNPLVTFTMLGEKTTVMSPEVLVGAGIPCCRLVQNAGEFVVTFPGAYHSGFSHGFNCAEAANIATPGWLGVAKDAAIRRASTNTPPMVSHYQLLYSLALSVWPRAPKSTPSMEPKSSRLKGKVKNEVETMVKETFVESMMQNNNFISMLVDRGGSCMILPHRLSDDISGKIAMKSKLGFGQYQKGLFDKRECDIESGLLDGGLLSCVMCGILSFACVAVVQPREKAARYLMTTTNCNFFKDRSGTSDDSSDVDDMPSWDADPSNLFTSDAGQGLNIANNSNKIEETNNNTALALLASAYSASDSEEEVLNDNATGCSFLRSCSNGQFTGEDHRVKEESTIDVLSCDKDSSRKHVFCLEHALKVWRELQKIGGADIILLCHPEYPKIEAEAKRMARELGMIYHWKEFNFRESTEQHQKQIKSALEDEEAVPTKSDWAVKMGINLYYSANQSKSPLYSKQMPYNAIIYKAFGQQMVSEFERPRQGRQKKIVVAGRWCGKVWMTNQVHPYLACSKEEKDDVDSEGEQLYFRVPVDNIEHIGCVSGGSSSKSRVLKRVSGSKRKEPVGPKRRSQRVTGVKPEISQTVVVTDQRCSTTTRIVTDHTCSMTTRSQRVRRKPAKYASSYVSEDEQEEQGGGEEEKGESKGETSSSHKCGTARKSRSVRKSRVSDESILDEIEHDNEDESEKESVRKRGRKSRSVQKTRVSDESILKEIEHNSEDESEKELVRTTGRKSRSVQKTRISYESILDEIKHDSEDESEEEPVQSKGRKKTLKQEIETNLEFKCDIEFCPMSFKTKQELTTHKRNICPIKGCGKKFFSHKYMVSHHKVHLDDRPLKCPWKGCKMAFKWPWARTEHIRVHTGARPYVCKEPGCVQTFRFVSDFSRHKRKTGHNTKGNKREK